MNSVKEVKPTIVRKKEDNIIPEERVPVVQPEDPIIAPQV